MQKFPPDSQEYADLQIFIENVKKMYPSTVVGDPRSSVVEGNVGTVRAAGKPDYSIDGGPVVDGHVWFFAWFDLKHLINEIHEVWACNHVSLMHC